MISRWSIDRSWEKLHHPKAIAEIFDLALNERPTTEALVTRSVRWSYRELDDACARATQALVDLGVKRGDRVAACLPNDAAIVVAFHAAMRLGAIWVGINQALAEPERRYLLDDSGASLFLTQANWSMAHVGASPPRRDLPPVDPHAPAALAYTSGTTGRPKGVIHSQHNLLLPGRVLVATRAYDLTLRKGDCLPLTILNMMVLTTLLTAQAGGTCVVMDEMFAEGVAGWIEREQVTVWNGPPALLHSLVTTSRIDRAALGSLREVWSGGSEIAESLRERFAERFGHSIIGTYGLTEAPTVVSIDPPHGAHVERASGRVLPHLDVSVADPVEGLGEICLRAAAGGPFANEYTPMLGYWNRPTESSEVATGGLVHTGDIGFVDDDGWLHVRDRRNLVIIRGGANVYPAEIERVLNAISGVAASVAFGVPDERLGERVMAVVEADPGAVVNTDVLRKRCSEQLARYKVPEQITVVDALPRNAMGKIERKRPPT